jgi:hypothetical protein
MKSRFGSPDFNSGSVTRRTQDKPALPLEDQFMTVSSTLFRPLIGVCLIAAACTMAGAANAQVATADTTVRLTVVGDETITLSHPAQRVEEGFSVRAANAAGQPVPGLVVDFFVDHLLQIEPAPIGSPPLPPGESYGVFDTPNGWTSASTDGNGIARSGPFIGGTVRGKYQIAAHAGPSHPENAGLIVPGPFAFITIQQPFGTFGPAELPALSIGTLAALGSILLLVGVFRLRSRRNFRR